LEGVKVVGELIIDGFLSEDKELLIDEIMNKYGQEILQLTYSYVNNRAIAEDLTQDIFVKCYKNLHTYSGKLLAFIEPEKYSTGAGYTILKMLFGLILVMILLLLFAARMIAIHSKIKDSYGKLLLIGGVTLIASSC
jgi:cell division protein FtsW (lipid II flippase)